MSRFEEELVQVHKEASRLARSMPILYGVMHATVDLASVAAVCRAARVAPSDYLTPFEILIAYDLAAFALQGPLGLLADRLGKARGALLGGLLLTACSVLFVQRSSLLTMAIAGLGNALFHLGAGALVLSSSRGRAAPAGVFVAPGALGLGLGLWLGRRSDGPIWPVALPVAVSLIAAALLPSPEAQPLLQSDEPSARELSRRTVPAVLALLLASVMVRSFVGFGGSYECPKTAWLLWGLPLVGFFGKLLGGPISDRFGWIETSLGALLLSAPLIAFSGGSPIVVLAGLFVFQATMPVTLTAVYRLLPNRPATAFGLPCVALVAGALPTFYPGGRLLYGSYMFLGLILGSAVAVFAALALLGVRRKSERTDTGQFPAESQLEA